MLVEMVTEVLTEAGYTVVTAAAARPGLDLAKAERPDLILMDASLPDMTGDDAVRALKADAATRAIPVVAITGSLDPDRMMAAGCLAFIPKFVPERFVGLVAELLEQTVGRRPRKDG
ncbi:MAG: response regulator [Candidatus Rokuibacteriota bacterium]